MMKSKTFFLIFFLVLITSVFSIPLDELIGFENVNRLRSGSISEMQLKKPALKLLPVFPELRKIIGNSMTVLEPTIAVETLYLYKKPDSADRWNNTQRTDLLNKMMALSTLTGIEYFSASRKTMRTFYEYSTVIDGPDTKNTISDPVFEHPPAQYTLFARQKDLTFGDNIYRYEYTVVEDALFFFQENMTAMNYGIIQAVGKNRLQSVLAVIDCGDSLLIYAVSMAKTASIPGMTDRVGNSFKNRADAIYKWFASGADKVF
jgi:hypothetical protein